MQSSATCRAAVGCPQEGSTSRGRTAGGALQAQGDTLCDLSPAHPVKRKGFRRDGHLHDGQKPDRRFQAHGGFSQETRQALAALVRRRLRSSGETARLHLREQHRGAKRGWDPRIEGTGCGQIREAGSGASFLPEAARRDRQTRGRLIKGSKYLWLRNFLDLRLQPSFLQL